MYILIHQNKVRKAENARIDLNLEFSLSLSVFYRSQKGTNPLMHKKLLEKSYTKH
jgi:hypothetical protein